jgi:hypothetical protein
MTKGPISRRAAHPVRQGGIPKELLTLYDGTVLCSEQKSREGV